jgi:undecaprenyl-phosphate 4-deoxy-4-formamido-L-arabinose transferase
MDFEESLSIVVPVYNSEARLPLWLEHLEPVAAAYARNFEAILVNDGSRGRSWEVICQLTARYPWVLGISLMRNYGQHNALLCGIRAARNEVIVTLDGDLQNPPEDIPKLLDKLAEGYDVVYGAPEQERHGLWRDLASRVTKIALPSALGSQTGRHSGAFRAFRTEVRGRFTNLQGPFVSDVLPAWGASHFAAVRVPPDARRLGTSQPPPAMRQRVRNPEEVFVVDQLAGFPPLTAEEIEVLAARLSAPA